MLRERWVALVGASDKAAFFKETRDRKISRPYPCLIEKEPSLPPLDSAKENDFSTPVRYSFRSFDRQFIIPDNRLGDYFRPVLWRGIEQSPSLLGEFLCLAS